MRWIVLLLAAMMAGCVSETPESPLEPSVSPHVLLGTAEVMDLVAPVFDLGPSIDTGGEPSIWAHTDGTIYLSYPGCAKDFDPCRHGPVYRSDDEGATWVLLNTQPEQRLTPEDEAPNANGDADVAVDVEGNVYTSNLGSGIQFFRSQDRGETWQFMANVVPDGHWADRQWMTAYNDGQVIMTWMGGGPAFVADGQRAVAIRTTLDGGGTWTDIQYLGQNIGWLGSAQYSPDGQHAFIPYTQPLNAIDDTATMIIDPEIGMFVAHSSDGGMTWSSIDTGYTFTKNPAGTHWAGSLMAPSLDVTGDGTVVLAWAEETFDVIDHSNGIAARSYIITSADEGTSWSDPQLISGDRTGIMPWVTGGAGDRVAVNYYAASDVTVDSDYQGTWDVEVAVIDVGTAEMVRTVAATGVHEGGICSRGGLCFTTASDRSFLDFFEADLMPDGRLVVALNSDASVDRGIHLALQTGGSLLLAPADDTI